MVQARWVLLALWSLAWLVARRHVVGDWPFFLRGAAELLGPHPLSLYAVAPQLQIGPLALVAGLPLRGAPRWLVQALLYGVGLLALRLMELCVLEMDAQRPERAAGHRARLLAAGLLVVPCWAFLAASGHLDDALVVLLTAAAALAVARDRSLAAGVLLGAAAAAKPWAVVALPLLLALPARRRHVAAALAAGAAALAWLPFVIGDRRTVAALAAFRISVAHTSGLHLLGIAGGACPGWVRPVQALLGLALGVLVVRRGHWEAVPAVGFAARVALDPGAMGYYAAAVAVAVLLVDLRAARALPLGALAVFGGLFYPAYLVLQAARHGHVAFTAPVGALVVAGLRVAACGAVVAVAVGGPLRPRDAATVVPCAPWWSTTRSSLTS